jgi:hypothetical protein
MHAGRFHGNTSGISSVNLFNATAALTARQYIDTELGKGGQDECPMWVMY